MKKYMLLICLLPLMKIYGQTSIEYFPKPYASTGILTSTYSPVLSVQQWYVNMEKYWYYRYKLVNDFMLVGVGEGMSIPAQKRNLGDGYGDNYIHKQGDAGCLNMLEWQDATIDLGHYISTLATEYKILNDNHWDVTRTLYELQLAQNALYRLCNNASAYESDPTLYPSIGINTTTINTTYLSTGFFLRNDVPCATFSDPNYSHDNFLHFNRIGINPTQLPTATKAVSSVFGAFTSSYTGSDPTGNFTPHWPRPSPRTPDFPDVESQDQLEEVFIGESLMAKYLSGNPLGLQTSAQQAIGHLIDWPSYSPKLQYWSIPDVNDNTKCAKYDCSSTGIIFTYAAGMVDAGWKYGDHSKLLGDKTLIDASPLYMGFFSYPMVYELSQFVPILPCGSNSLDAVSYEDGYAAFANDWTVYVPPVGLPWTPGYQIPLLIDYAAFLTKGGGAYSSYNTTFYSLVKHAWGDYYGFIQYPLLWELNNYDKLTWAVSIVPPSVRIPYFGPWIGHDYISGLLDKAPPCGPYNYANSKRTDASGAQLHSYNSPNGDFWNSSGKAYGDWEWSGNDRLSEPYHRAGQGCYLWNCDDAEYNGLDYMMLFNLFSLERGGAGHSYLQGVINPYYCENFEIDYPDANGYGTGINRLKLNWLEFLSMRDHIHAGTGSSQGWLSCRGAKKIDLLPNDPVSGKPGFQADYGSFFQASVKDYDCNGGDNGTDGAYNFATLNPVAPYLIYRRPDSTYDTVINREQGRDIPIEYFPQGPGFKTDLLPKDPHPEQDKQIDSLLTPEFIASYLKAYKYLLYNDPKKDPEKLLLVQKMFGWEGDTIENYLLQRNDSIVAEIYPNPTNDISYLSYKSSKGGDVRIILTTTLGQDVSYLIEPYEHNTEAGEHKITIHSEKLMPGVYYCSISLNGQIITKKLVVTN